MHAVCTPSTGVPQLVRPVEHVSEMQAECKRMQGADALPRAGQVLDPGPKSRAARPPHQAAAPAVASHVLQDGQPAAVLRGYAEAQAPELDVAWRRVHAQAGAMLPDRPGRGGVRVHRLHDWRPGRAARPEDQLSEPHASSSAPLAPSACTPCCPRCPLAAPSCSAVPPCVPGSCLSWQPAWHLKSGLA